MSEEHSECTEVWANRRRRFVFPGAPISLTHRHVGAEHARKPLPKEPRHDRQEEDAGDALPGM